MDSIKTESIEVAHIYSGILAGADRVVMHCEELNSSNGFPVPDMDTGNNLSFLMNRIVNEIEIKKNVKEFMQTVSNAALLGARGNSGAIFSQFFYGFETACPETPFIKKEGLIDCFDKAYEFAYKAIGQPVEGTIITAIRSYAQALRLKSMESIKLDELLEFGYRNLKKTVTDTKHMLPEQVALDKEDAGAKAFLLFIEGFMKMLIDKVNVYNSISAKTIEKPEYVENLIHNQIENPKNRFCTEVLIKKTKDIDRESLQNKLIEYGDSVVISQNKAFLRAHIHSNTPYSVVELLSGMGEVVEVKADDMKLQSILSNKDIKRTALIVDSIADLPVEFFEDFVFQMPLNLIVDNVSYQDKRTVYPRLLEKGKASSAQPNIDEVNSFLKPIASTYENVIVLCVSQKMSGVYSTFVKAAQSYGNKVTVIDTLLNSVAEGLVAAKAIKAISDGKGVSEIVDMLNRIIEATKIFVSLPNLKAMVSSGRLNERIGYFLQKLGFLPLITINDKGEGALSGVAFSKNKNEKLLLKQLERVKDNIEEYAIVHAEAYDRALIFAKQIEEIVGKPPLYIDEISSIVKIFSGKGSVAVGYIERS